MLQRGSDRVISIKSKQGQILRIVRERYLRDDIKCRISSCKLCGVGFDCIAPPTSHLLFPDLETSLNYLNLFETLSVTGIIFAQTILDAIENEMHFSNRRRLIRRFRTLVADKRRESAIFSNEYFSATYYERPLGQTLKLRRDMAIAKLAGWFVAHRKQSESFTCPIILITSIEEVKRYAVSLGVTVLTMQEYMAQYRPSSDLEIFDAINLILEEDKLKKDAPKSETETMDDVDPFEKFSKFWSDAALDSGIKSGLLYRGKIQVNRGSSHEASIKYKNALGVQTTMIIPSDTLRNRAVHGDTVVVAPIDIRKVQATFPRFREIDGPFGRVVGIETQNWRNYVCTLQLDDNSSQNSSGWLLAVPWDSRIPKIRIKSRQGSELMNSRILVQIDSWDVDSHYPQGHYIKNLGQIGLHETEMQVLLHEYDVDTAPFPPRVLAELPEHSPPTTIWKPVMDDPTRRDITDWRVYSIDPPGCQDIDDALSYREVDGKIQIGVHIADVTAFVKEGSQLDLEAQARATSVYLTDRRIDMLPTLLSERLCSLRCNEPRYAVSVIWELDASFNVLDIWYGRTMIKTIYEMCYGDAQDILDDKPAAKSKFEDFAQLRFELQGLQRVFHKLRDGRSARGALELEGVEVSFQLDGDKKPKKVQTKEALEVHALVAEFMIYANCTVAEYLARNIPEASMLRRHPLPASSKFKDVIELAASKGLVMDFSSNLTLAQSLHNAEKLGDPMFTLTLRSLTTLALAEAEYMSSGSFSIAEYYHYGLAADYYTHFTSPIRRYADVMVHRQLLAILEQKARVKSNASSKPSSAAASTPLSHIRTTTSASSNPHSKASSSASETAAKQTSNVEDSTIYTPSNAQVQDIADHLNYKNRQSKLVQRDSKDLYQNMFFSTREDATSTEYAVVIALKNNGLLLYFPKYGYQNTLTLKSASSLQSSSAEPSRFNASAFPSQRNIKSTETGEYALQSLSSPVGKSEMILKFSPSLSHTVKLFDCISAQISVSESRYHMGSIHFNHVRFEDRSYDEITQETQRSSDANQTSLSKSSSTVGPAMSAKSMIRHVLDSEQIAKNKLLEERQNLLPSELVGLWKAKDDTLYRWAGMKLSSKNPLSVTNTSRVLTAFVLSRRGLQPYFYAPTTPPQAAARKQTDTADTPKIRIRQPICLFPRKMPSVPGRRVFKEAEYREALAAAKEEYYEEEYDENDPHPASASIPGLEFGPSNSFGSTHLTTQSQLARLGEAAARAEMEFKKAQAQVSKSKYASRHY